MDELSQQVEVQQQQIEDLQTQLVRAQKMSSVGEMAASITHEFNNILTTTINYAKMGLRHKNDATREKAFNRILSAGQRAARITTGMLGYARSTGVRKEEIDLSQIVSDVLILCEKDLQMNRVKLQTDILGHPVCEVNISHLQQVLLNLIVNARQAMDGGGMLFVTVRSSKDGSMGELEVRDTGAGIPSEELPKIFKPFFHDERSRQQRPGRNGPGISLLPGGHRVAQRKNASCQQGRTGDVFHSDAARRRCSRKPKISLIRRPR